MIISVFCMRLLFFSTYNLKNTTTTYKRTRNMDQTYSYSFVLSKQLCTLSRSYLGFFSPNHFCTELKKRDKQVRNTSFHYII